MYMHIYTYIYIQIDELVVFDLVGSQKFLTNISWQHATPFWRLPSRATHATPTPTNIHTYTYRETVSSWDLATMAPPMTAAATAMPMTSATVGLGLA